MTVFKGYMKITKRNAAMIILYLAVFFGITLMIQSVTKDSEAGDSYQAQSIKIGFVDEDGGALAKGFEEYLDKYHQMIPLENNKEVLQENLFYQNVEYIVKVPKGFEEKCLGGNEKLAVTKVPGSYTSFYVDQQINNFLNSVKTYYAAGYTAKEAAEAVNAKEETEIKMLDVNGNAGEIPSYTYYYRYIPYLLLCVLCYVLGSILSSFRKEDIKKRMQASAVSVRRQNAEALAAASVFGLALWGVSVLGGFVLYGESFSASPNVPYYLLNSLAMLFVALALAYLVGMLTNSINSLNGLVNTLSLGMCFLCGVFVPLNILSKSVKTVAQFLPVYWYEKANDMLSEFGNITGSIRTEVLQAIGIQMIFAVAIVCIAMVAARRNRLGGC